MIRTQKIKKYIWLTLCILTICITNINKVRAEDETDIPLIKNEVEETKEETTNENAEPSYTRTYNNGTCKITDSCYISVKSYYSSKVVAKIYNYSTGEVIKNVLDPNDSNWKGILAGTYIGVNIYEEVTAWTAVSTSATSSGVSMSCSCPKYGPCPEKELPKLPNNHNNIMVERVAFQENQCKIGTTSKAWTGSCSAGCSEVTGGACAGNEADAATWCKSLAPTASPPMSYKTQSYDIIYPNSNDINGATIPPTAATCNNSDEYTGDKAGGTCTFNYSLGNVCMNVNTGIVRYTSAQECNEGEYLLEKDGEYYKYFIPLNANSIDDIKIVLSPKGESKSVDVCTNLINTHDNFYRLIATASGRTFSKDTTKEDAKEMVVEDKGCRYTTTITIPIEQKFYNEITDTKSFKGFNFYYKSIDINNPFPNGRSNTSIWYNWSQSDTKNPDLTKSYSEKTYEATYINPNEIRKYNEDNPYTSWENMTYKGLSKFIENKEIVTRLTDKNNIYALGCGPENENKYLDDAKTKKNPLYQKECDKS